MCIEHQLISNEHTAVAKSTIIWSQVKCDVPGYLEIICIYEFWLPATELRKITDSPLMYAKVVDVNLM
jgi:hypothetical protein